MTFAPAADAPAAATEEMAVLLLSARQASRALRQHPRPEVSTASQIAQALSDDISGTARLIGVDTTEGWRLLDLRDRLDSHVLAVTALDGTGVRDDVVLDLIGRAVIDLVVNLRQ
jgi:hypothetical protein